MAAFTLTSCKVQVGTGWTGTAPGNPGTQTVSGTITTPTDISAMVTSIDLALAADELDYSNMASGGWRLKLGGMKAGTIQLNFNQDFAASQVDAIFGLGGTLGFMSSSNLYMDIMPTNSARAATNPSYVLQFLNLDYKPITGSVGDLAVVQLSFPTTGQVARLTS